jgi:hypothetical protein
MKIAILFRGPIRPNPASVEHKFRIFMQQFVGAQAEIHTYLATWRNWHHHKASDLINLNIFDNVIMQTEPTMQQIRRCTDLDEIKNGMPIHGVYKMYYQSKHALDIIMNADDYDYIVHTRTDLYMIMDRIQEWFDPNYYVTPHVKPPGFTYSQPQLRPPTFICDQFGVATAANMHKAWDYGTLANLDQLFKDAAIPESVLDMMLERAGVNSKEGPYKVWKLDDIRNTA